MYIIHNFPFSIELESPKTGVWKKKINCKCGVEWSADNRRRSYFNRITGGTKVEYAGRDKVHLINRISRSDKKFIQSIKYPWLVAIWSRNPNAHGHGSWTYERDGRICGGTIIASKFVITAAHCFGDSAEQLGVRIGDYDLKKDFFPQSERTGETGREKFIRVQKIHKGSLKKWEFS